MIAVFLDETGSFEKQGQNPANAGLLYVGDGLANKIKDLKERLDGYCKKYGLCYPDGPSGNSAPPTHGYNLSTLFHSIIDSSDKGHRIRLSYHKGSKGTF